MTTGSHIAWDDTVLPFQLDLPLIRGRVARLDGVLDNVLAQHHYPLVPFRSIIVDRFDALRDVAQVGAPVLVLHGDRDDVVPQRLGRQLYDAAADPKEAVWIPGGPHNDLWSRGAGDAIVRFVTARTR
jgi:fermentation-respiration switch protein FrsA (DUF1100 family)